MGDDLLIDLVRKYDFLYDKKKAEFKNKLVKENAWITIAEIMEDIRENVEARWNVLRNRYNLERRKVKTTPSGSSSDDPYKSYWSLYKLMGFLDPFIVSRRTFGNVAKKKSSPAETTLAPASPSTPSTATAIAPSPATVTSKSRPLPSPFDSFDVMTRPDEPLGSDERQEDSSSNESLSLQQITDFRKRASGIRRELLVKKQHEKQKHLTDVIQSTFTELQTFLKDSPAPTPTHDEDALFSQAVAETLRKCSNRKKKSAAKARIFQILQDIESDSN